MKPRKTSKRVIGMIVGVTTGVLAFVFVNQILYPESAPKVNDKLNDLKQMVIEMNNVAPTMVNNAMRFDSVAVISHNMLQYSYTMVNVYKDSVNSADFDDRQKSALINIIKLKDSQQFIRTQQLTVVYCYYDKNGVLFSKINISPDMYK